MPPLTPHECRVLGVLIEKAQTTPAQYPLTLNGLITGSNQKSNRLPELALSEDDVLTALDGLRAKSLSREVMMSGSRVEKHRHIARETLEVSTSELVVLAELLLRGPQTVGELRGRASRMHPLESLDTTSAVLDHLMERDPPLVRTVAPAPGSRAPRFAQLLCPELHRVEAVGPGAEPRAVVAVPSAAPADAELESRVDRLESDVAELRRSIERLTEALGGDPGAAPRAAPTGS
ncbi:MAG: DUF480 domain-containing protein [Planctomycetes bacterium]|nr:DUF480 domain-containing protein [Planctomycetota bacterium]